MKPGTWLPGNITISKYSGGDDGGSIAIDVMDGLSRTKLVEIRLDLAEFANALLAHRDAECRFHHYGGQFTGLRREHKQETLFVPDVVSYRSSRSEGWLDTDPLVAQGLAPYEIDGWRANRGDLVNGHQRLDVPGRLSKQGPSVAQAAEHRQATIQAALKAGLDRYTETEPFKGGLFLVSFVRYVDPNTELPAEWPTKDEA